MPPEVNTTSDGRAPSAWAIVSRDSSTTRRAARPEVCSDEGLPRPHLGPIASITWGSIGRGGRVVEVDGGTGHRTSLGAALSRTSRARVHARRRAAPRPSRLGAGAPGPAAGRRRGQAARAARLRTSRGPGGWWSGSALGGLDRLGGLGRTLNRSPTTPKSTSSKIGASSSLLTATIVLEVCMPARCWIAPEMPAATYSWGDTACRSGRPGWCAGTSRRRPRRGTRRPRRRGRRRTPRPARSHRPCRGHRRRRSRPRSGRAGRSPRGAGGR